ncbi:Receptor-type guanylate cyclase gcy [Seminavis robusta]|uniref:Receptor-type guanylate cyclase gcy n=1 Tax=Seminavis robusta TaxID=568900 RepID=A0A9N8HB90_9STRA|nr:Receptor-type guanylate cyclase gcy [Seminavis robusta]|eukprot:Sro327_g118350.1 Receptor-type guanylate cyclase gcy (1378) ;mRNA; r:29770-35808
MDMAQQINRQSSSGMSETSSVYAQRQRQALDELSLSESSNRSSGSVASFNSGYSETTRGTDHVSEGNRSQAEDAIVDSLSSVVSRWRTCVVLMLLITATLVVSTTYVFLSNSEDAQFRKSFEKSAESIKDSVEFHATNAVQTFENLADGITSEALTANATWPFFTSDNFEVKAAHARLNAFAECVFFMPLVLGKQRKQWEDYSIRNANRWIQQSDTLGVETDQWLLESGFYESHEGHGRNLQQQQASAGAAVPSRTTTPPTTMTNPPTTTTAPPTTTTMPPQNDANIAEEIFLKGEDLPGGMEGDTTTVSEGFRAYYAPVWQVSPPPVEPTLVNYNILADANSGGTFNAIQVSGNKAIVSDLLKTSSIDFFYSGLMSLDDHWGYHSNSDASNHQEMYQSHTDDATGTTSMHESPGAFPHSSTIAPVRASFEPNAPTVGFVLGIAPWDLYLSRLLPEGTNGVYAVLSNSCAQEVTYKINGPTAVYLGKGDLHEEKYNNLKQSLSFTGFGLSTEASRRAGQCDYSLSLYASDEYRSDYDDSKPAIFTAVLASVFVATGIVFFIFAAYVQQRQHKIMTTALRTNAIVASLFPANVRARILKDAEDQIQDDKNNNANGGNFNNNNTQGKRNEHRSDSQNLKSYLHEEQEGRRSVLESVDDSDGDVIDTNIFGSKPIADLFPETTLMFADLVGFTAWSSMREPSQVFTLLETVYHSFDQIANKRRVFKVETVGDCYVAVTGVPEPRKDHAVVMCRFAKDCLDKLRPLLKKLELVLGPDTGDLSMRFGLHSGPVTAGVLRGERARFQLFGDTMNTCSRIETTGRTGHIHISQQTADLLKAAGKGGWYVPRKDKVMAKGKGELQTYWLTFRQTDVVSSGSGGSQSQASIASEEMTQNEEQPEEQARSGDLLHPIGLEGTMNRDVKITKKAQRLVDWNVDILSRLLQQIVARRESEGGRTLRGAELGPIEQGMGKGGEHDVVLDEVKEIIQLPKYDNAAARSREQVDPKNIRLPKEVTDQLRTYVSTIASLYRDTVPFHNFEHASHVTMSVVKLLSRIVAPKAVSSDGEGDFNKELHDHTYGIASDPLTQFAVVMSALMHDVDHVGVPNIQLVKEKAAICAKYRNQSVAEQNSVDMSWHLLMDPDFQDLRATIYSSQEELTRFRQLVVNTVLATDIVDKELKELRNARWDRAFHHPKRQWSSSSLVSADPEQPEQVPINRKKQRNSSVYNDDSTNRKATIVIEHIIQASDIAHTMQHWHIYRKWNERFFQENMLAYQLGRAAKDPSEYWYKGEIGFFDFYIIPLAKKLEECGVFGVSSHEYRQYALANREEWVSKGEQLVEEMKAKYSGEAEPTARRSSLLGGLGAQGQSQRRNTRRESFHDEEK